MQKIFIFFYAFLLAILGIGVTLMAEDITLTTYYPAPYGAYNELATTGKTCLATTSGNVGIGTTAPARKLDIKTSDQFDLGIFSDAIGGDWNVIDMRTGRYNAMIGTRTNAFWQMGWRQEDVPGDTDRWYIGRSSISSSDLVVNRQGNVGIGTAGPTATLHVNGNIKAVLGASGAVVPVTYNAGTNVIGLDIAELFNTSEEVEPGDLLVIDETQDIRLRKSSKPYEKGVIGIVSGSPAILFEDSELEIAPKPNGFTKGIKPPVALVGRIQCNVSIENGPIEKGDLLTSSSTAGHAMKATDMNKSFGTIVGKALQAFNGGPNGEKEGKIIILVTLQ